MKVFVIGANGHTGTQVIDLGLARGHEVTAFVRSPEKIKRQHPLLKVLRGDPHNVDELANALKGQDVVVSALGVRPPKAFRPHTLVQECAASTVAAMTKAGVKRLVLVFVAVLFPEKGLRFAFFCWLLSHIMRDLGTAEEIVRATPLEWTLRVRRDSRTDLTNRIGLGATRFRRMVSQCRFAPSQPSCWMPWSIIRTCERSSV
jgi:uncharacterized protein YbjT (DUF2867 family)